MTLPTTDIGFIVAGWGVILGGMTLYAVVLLRRLGAARATSLEIRRAADEASQPSGSPSSASPPQADRPR